MSSGYKCTECGLTAYSKCVNQRNVFPEDMLATMIGNMIKIEAVRRGSKHENWRRESDSDVWMVTYTIESGYVKAQDEEEAIKSADIPSMFLDTKPETLKRAFCDHRWKIVEGTCQFGCCVAE